MCNGFKVHITVVQVKVAISTKAGGQSHTSASGLMLNMSFIPDQEICINAELIVNFA